MSVNQKFMKRAAIRFRTLLLEFTVFTHQAAPLQIN